MSSRQCIHAACLAAAMLIVPCAARAQQQGPADAQGYWAVGTYTLDLETGISDDATNTIQGNPLPDKAKAHSVITDTPDGLIPYQPWAQQRRLHLPTYKRGPTSEGKPTTMRDVRPPTFCIAGMPHQNWFGEWRLIATSDSLIQQWEGSHAYRTISLDPKRQHPPASVKLVMGDSIGHWDGRTLVVETTNLNDWDWFDSTGTFHSDAMALVERYTFVDAKTMTYQVTITDPVVLARPFTITLPFRKRAHPADYELYEEACVEGTRGTDKLIGAN